MRLPFTEEQFFDLFAAYNEAVWPALVALWIASVVGSAMLLVSRHARRDRWIAALLAAHWAWSALAYHAAYFTRINSAAWGFAALFLLQSALLFWWGVVQQRLSFVGTRGRWTIVAWILIVYSLAYPGINALQHLSVLRIPAFGVPCPTTIFTAGVLMLDAQRPWHVSIIPVAWSVIGGSAAFLLNVSADYALLIAGLALVVSSLQRPSASRAIVAGSSTRDDAI